MPKIIKIGQFLRVRLIQEIKGGRFFGHGVHVYAYWARSINVEAKKNQKLIDTGMWHKKSMGTTWIRNCCFPIQSWRSGPT